MPRQKRPNRELNFVARKPSIDEILTAASELNRTSTDFLKIDLQTALTFSRIALENNTDNEKRRRNRRNARRGYDTIIRLIKRVSLSDGDAKFMSYNLERLKSELRQLGEVF
jgi:hypothetical protein